MPKKPIVKITVDEVCAEVHAAVEKLSRSLIKNPDFKRGHKDGLTLSKLPFNVNKEYVCGFESGLILRRIRIRRRCQVELMAIAKLLKIFKGVRAKK